MSLTQNALASFNDFGQWDFQWLKINKGSSAPVHVFTLLGQNAQGQAATLNIVGKSVLGVTGQMGNAGAATLTVAGTTASSPALTGQSATGGAATLTATGISVGSSVVNIMGATSTGNAFSSSNVLASSTVYPQGMVGNAGIATLSVAGSSAINITGQTSTGGAAALTATGAAGGTCTVKDSIGASPNDTQPVGDQSLRAYYASDFVAGSTYTMSQLSVWLYKVGSPTGVVTVYLYSTSSSTPNTVLCTSGTIAASTLTTSTSGQEYKFACSASLTSGTTYAAVVSNSVVDASNYVVWVAQDTGSQPTYRSAYGSTWTQDSGTGFINTFKTYSGTCP